MNVLICDDDKYVRKMLEQITSKNKNISKIFKAADGLEAVKIAEEEIIDIALLDIDMPNLDGIEAAKIISKITPETCFIFITGHMEYAVDSFCVHPYDYLLKPIDIDNFPVILNELITLIQKQKSREEDKTIDKIIIKEGQDIRFVPAEDILYFEKVGGDVLVHTVKDAYTLSKKTLGELEDALGSGFIRSHRSFIVNRQKLKKIKDVGNRTYQIEFFDSEKEAGLSRKKYQEIVKNLSFYLKG